MGIAGGEAGRIEELRQNRTIDGMVVNECREEMVFTERRRSDAAKPS
jgi:hypothetical protein